MTATDSVPRLEWIRGDHSSLHIPATPEALHGRGIEFLTTAFRHSGVLGPGNAVEEVVDWCDVTAGSTGRKATFSITYRSPVSSLPTELFVKFSRDFDDAFRDRGRSQMKPEVSFAELSRTPEFPIVVPETLFADYHAESGTGILITERIAFGSHGIEPQYAKCCDYEIPDPVEHYRAIFTALARLAGAHRAGRRPNDLVGRLANKSTSMARPAPGPREDERLRRQLDELADFARTYPNLLPDNVGDPKFLARIAVEAPRLQVASTAIRERLGGRPEFIALCHWNANVDNAWFWRDSSGDLQCGLLDWGSVGPMSVAAAVGGALMAAETSLWNEHLDDLLEHFTDVLAESSGPAIDPNDLREHLLLGLGLGGLDWLLGIPARIATQLGKEGTTLTRTNPRIRDDESIRAPLQMLVILLNAWQTYDLPSTAKLDEVT
ncbi:hypothetical protein AAFP35_11560 [Gordonia sp. CPCC 206044]|uniref:hypothetical protein n=1 Tax=Gordonia sp. CPCC 206044 TaxID=3140793 RepID=UPI003AF38600